MGEQKVIHYCWFGENPLPDSAVKCIESWKKYFPGYSIKEWNESNFNIENTCEYVREAYKEKKWAFVSDYARFKILYEEGGIYFDTDVEVIRDMSILIKRCDGFMGEEKDTYSNSNVYKVNPGLGIYSKSGLDIFKEILDYYNTLHFLDEDGKFNGKTVVDYTTEILKRHGFRGSGEIEKIQNIVIYPTEYFCPMDSLSGRINISENTYSIHHYTASWQSNYDRFKTQVQRRIGPKMTNRIIKIKRLFKRCDSR